MDNKVKRSLFGLALFSFFIIGCKDDDEPLSKEEKVLRDLRRTWTLVEARKDDVILTDAFNELTVTFDADRTLNVKNAVPPIWPESTQIEEPVLDGNSVTLKRSDGFIMNLVNLTKESLTVEIDYDAGIPGGRVRGVSGNYFFEFAGE